jgi:hypothetical protein
MLVLDPLRRPSLLTFTHLDLLFRPYSLASPANLVMTGTLMATDARVNSL